MCAHLTDYRLQRKCLYGKRSNEWVGSGNNVWFCTLRIVRTVYAASICHSVWDARRKI